MTTLTALVLALLLVLAAAYLPGYAVARMLKASPLLSLALAPALAAAIAGGGAVLASAVGLRWSLIPFLLVTALLAVAAAGLRRMGATLPATVLDGALAPRRAVPGAAVWLAAAVAVALVPIALQAGRPDAVLERWDTLYHLSALQHVRETGIASSLQVGAISNTQGNSTYYPAAFHALAALVPAVPTATLPNAAVLALAVTPWILGTALLARTVLPAVPWAPFAAAIAATLVPATPLALWIHLSPITNLVGFAALPGALAAAAALWGALLPGTAMRPALAAVAAVGTAGAGLGLTHPNVAVTALILLAVLTAVTSAPRWGRRPALIAVPVLAALPVALLSYTPLGAHVTGFSGGLEVSWWLALGEVLLGLLTVWPMALGVVIAVLWWPGLVTAMR